ncbi:MAG TPA: tRNA preQ1(34) S-adenosylmethionine ribosyltransferase-isomerase QueA [Gemmatimonadales bacterium]|nr:tRNA preQ1(34) S-adenosylmethionine ribosyltransferase-isomerase QueA [Gemmatimonadales bacterium]
MTADRPLRTADFAYDLPPELIAQVPDPTRGASRMLLVRRGAGAPAREDLRFADLANLIPSGDLLVLNSTRVRHARLVGRRPSGAPAEVLLIHPATDGSWVAIGKPGSALREGKRITLGEGSEIETLAVLPEGERLVRFVGLPAEEAIARFGRLPLPPYIDRDPTAEDEDRYQTVYAEREGSVAAPTAGLHLTDELLAELRGRGVEVASLDLEVGPGTFKPVEEEDISAHPMHPERYEIPTAAADAVAAARARGAAVWAVGTTVVRALESAARLDGSVKAGTAETRLLIAPGYEFRVVDHLVTNFHLPRSTLLMLVAAFAGHDTMMAAYRHAVEARYRFYSYGDAMCIL